MYMEALGGTDQYCPSGHSAGQKAPSPQAVDTPSLPAFVTAIFAILETVATAPFVLELAGVVVAVVAAVEMLR